MLSISNQADFCLSTGFIRMTNLNLLQNLCGETFHPHVKKFTFVTEFHLQTICKQQYIWSYLYTKEGIKPFSTHTNGEGGFTHQRLILSMMSTA